ncbi:MAG: hypothetical protein II938_04730 [Alphaproteobacteria bacterium]|nr:hypothetical protein [Alphaproteobacteria bacterium]
MKKTHIIRPVDAKEYIGFQFEGLVETLEQFDYRGVAKVVRATHAVFNQSAPDGHEGVNPDCIFLKADKTHS